MTPAAQHRIQATLALAQWLERVEQRPGVFSADPYRALVLQLGELLRSPQLPDGARDAILQHSPEAAQVYENLLYPVAGLSRSPLEAATRAELAARELLGRLGQAGGKGATPGRSG